MEKLVLTVLYSGEREYITCPMCGKAKYNIIDMLRLSTRDDVNCTHCRALLVVEGAGGEISMNEWPYIMRGTGYPENLLASIKGVYLDKQGSWRKLE